MHHGTSNYHDARFLVLTHGGADRPSFLGMGNRFLRGMTGLVIGALLNTSLVPLVQAAQAERRNTVQAAATAPNDEARYASLVQDLARGATQATNSKERATSVLTLSTADSVSTLQSLASRMQDQWTALRTQWIKAGVPQEVIDRQLVIEQTFQRRHDQLMVLLKAATADGATLTQKRALAEFLQREQPRQTHLPINLKNMPWQVQKVVKIEPATDAQALDKKLRLSPPKAKAAKTSTSNMASAKEATAATPADLAPTLDAPQTADIKKLAADLGNNPHKIYQWVHDNIYWQPTHGSVQGAQNTLDKKAGNATDTASLLVATLRAAGVPARYVYGSIEVPADQMMNWVGGAKTVDAAQQVLGQGGIPNTALVSGGRITTVRLEHVWVEALIQYQPGRGAKHIPGQSTPDSWVPMDASFKQYTFKPGMDLGTAVPLDAQVLLSAAQQGAAVNAAEGWVQNLNTAALQSQLNAYQTRLKTYIDRQNSGNSTVGDVLGQRQATIDPLPYLAGTLPYTVRARTQQFSEVPNLLRTQFRYQIYLTERDASWDSSSLMSFQAPTASLAGKKLTLAWVAASAASQQALEAMVPANITDPSQLPRTIPASISLKPQILVDGVVKAEGSAMRAGDEPIGAGAFTNYGTGAWDQTTDQLIAGQQTALGLSIQGISQAQLNQLKTRMEQTKATLERAQAAPEAQRPAILKDITGDLLTGDLLTATLWGYFASLQSHGVIASSQAEMFDAPALSYGLFHAQVRPNKLYGIVTTGITFQGLNMDVGHLRHMRWVKDDNAQSAINDRPELRANGKTAAQNRWIAYNKMRGQYSSAMEHAVPEQFWVDRSLCKYTDENGQVKNPALQPCAEGVSAVKAIAIAQQQGQKIYTITAQNAATALPKLPVGGDVGDEIRNAVNAGKEVTVHQNQISAHGWTGYGYTIVDSDTGAGAYLIEGRGNGMWMELVNWVKDNPGWSAIAAMVLGLMAGFGGVLGFIFFLMSVAISAISLYHDFTAIANSECGVLGLQVLFGIFGLIAFGVGLLGGSIGVAIALAVFGFIWSFAYQGLHDSIKGNPRFCS